MGTQVTTSQDSAKITQIRAELPVLNRYVYLNTGTNGPLPKRTHAAMVKQYDTELEEGRILMSGFMRIAGIRDQARAKIAALLGCEPDEVAITHSTTEGMNMALLGIEWQEGDEIITANSEHEGGLNPIALVKERYGVKVHYTNIGLAGVDALAELDRYLNANTKAVVLSHVSWASGEVLPMREISEKSHAVGALVICDAAQSLGMVPAPVYDMGVDVYAGSGQKWFCGPDSTGAMFVRRDKLDTFKQSVMGYPSLQNRMISNDAVFAPNPTAKRFEPITMAPATIVGLDVSLDWITNEVGWDWAFKRITELSAYCYHALAGVEGVRLYQAEPQASGLIHFTLDGLTPPELTEKLLERGILIRHTPEPQQNRVSTGFYNTEAEIDRFVQAVAEIRASIK
jgi:L-cysteine/cystine lyase